MTFNFQIGILDSIIGVMFRDCKERSTPRFIKNTNTLFSICIKKSTESQEFISRYKLLKFITDIIMEGCTMNEIMITKIQSSKIYDDIIQNILLDIEKISRRLSPYDIKSLVKYIEDRLCNYLIIEKKDDMIAKLDNINMDNANSFNETKKELYRISNTIINLQRNIIVTDNDSSFCISDPLDFKESLNETLNEILSSSRFYRTGIQKLNEMLGGGYETNRLYMYGSLPSHGKAQPDDTLIPTPTGLKRLDELKIGDKVFNLDGEPTEVLNIFPQGVQDTYKVTFTDGRSTRCNIDHLWYTLSKNQYNEYIPIVRKLSDMIDDYEYIAPNSSDKIHYKYIIPNNGIARFEEQTIDIHPWIIGYLIGNECCGENDISISCPDKMLKILGYSFTKEHGLNYSYYFVDKNQSRVKIKDMIGNISEIYNKYLHEKRIPKEYIFNTENIRFELLKGLIDSDGCIFVNNKSCNTRFKISYSTTSFGLVEDIGILLHSLGLSYSYYKREVEQHTHDEYQLNINIPNQIMIKIFSIGKKSKKDFEALTYKRICNHDHIQICKIEKVEPTSQRCILVSDYRHIYLTEQFIPTHNSILLLKSALDMKIYNEPIKPKKKGKIPTIYLVVMENTKTETQDRMFSMITGDSLVNYTIDEAQRYLKQNGFIFDEDHNIDIVMEFCKYRSISTDDLYTKIQELNDENREVIGLILDYIKRIEPSIPDPQNEKHEIGMIMNELKALALTYHIPVISAYQPNRVAAQRLNDSTLKSQSDVGKLHSTDTTGSAYDIVEVADCIIAIHREMKSNSSQMYQSFKRLKHRSAKNNCIYFAHPYNIHCPIQLIDDINETTSLSVESLASPLLNEEKKMKKEKNKKYLDLIDEELELLD